MTYDIGSPASAQQSTLLALLATLRNRATTAQTALATGQVADPAASLSGRTATPALLEAQLSDIDFYSNNAALTASRLDAQQTALGTLSSTVTNVVGQTVTSIGATTAGGYSALVATAKGALQTAVAALNVSNAGRSLFAGSSGDQPALASADTILQTATDTYSSAIAGGQTPQQAMDAVKNLFDPSGPFAFYTGGTGPAPDSAVAPGISVGVDIRADQPTLRALLGSLTEIAVAAGQSTSLDTATLNGFLTTGIGDAQTAGDDLSGIQGTLGVAQQRVEDAQTRNASEKTALGTAVAGYFQEDPAAAATELSSVENALQALLASTAQLSQISLVNYL